MMCQNYSSVPIPYRTTDELFPTIFGGIRYSPEIPEPYAERLYAGAMSGIWVDGERVIVTSFTDMIYWPSYELLRWTFNANTGQFIERGPFVGGLYAADVNQGAGGELYLTYATGLIYPLGPAPGYELLEPISPLLYGYSIIDAPFFDIARNRAVLSGPSGTKSIKVYERVSGTLLRDIYVPAAPICIVHDAGTRIFALLGNKAIISLDYETAQCYSYVRLPQIGNPVLARIAWHKSYRRLLVIEYTPDNEDGTGTTVIRGYRYIDIPFHVCKPIPLARLREGVKSPVLLKQVGDLGEGIAGLISFTSTDAVGHVVRGSVPLDGDGEGRGEILGLAEGTEELTLSSEVTCLIDDVLAPPAPPPAPAPGPAPVPAPPAPPPPPPPPPAPIPPPESGVEWTGVTSEMWDEIELQGTAFADPNTAGLRARIAALPTSGGVTLNPGDDINAALESNSVVFLSGPTDTPIYVLTEIVRLPAGKKLLGAPGKTVMLDAYTNEIDRGVSMGAGSTLANVIVEGAKTFGVLTYLDGIYTNGSLIYQVAARKTGWYSTTSDGSIGFYVSSGSAYNSFVSCEASDSWNDLGAPNDHGGNSDGIDLREGAHDNTLIDFHALRNGDDGIDMWEGGRARVYFTRANDNGKTTGKVVTGDGNGIKLGIGNVSHQFYRTSADNNKSGGFNLNGNLQQPTLVETEASGNPDGDYMNGTDPP